MNEDDYGGSLAGVTGDFVVNSELFNGTPYAVDVMNLAAIEADKFYAIDSWEGTQTTTNTDTAATTIKPLLQSHLVNVTTANINSVTPTSASYTGLTELMDGSFTRAKTVQTAIAHGACAEFEEVASSLRFGATAQEIASVTVALREKIDGEGETA